MRARAAFHLLLHAALPVALAWMVARPAWRRASLLLLAGWLIDLDHLVADPVYAPDRCSLGFHPLHTWPAALAYGGLALPRPTRLLGAGLLLHLALDGLDCLMIGA